MSPTDRSAESSIEGQNENPPLSLEDLLELVATGRSESFRQVYDRTSAQVFGLACAVVRDAGSAQDVTREVFLEVWQLAGGFDRSAESALDWMMHLTRSKSIQCLHRRRMVRLRGEPPMLTDSKEVAAPGLLTSVVRQGSEYLMSLRPLATGLPLPR